MKMVVMSDPHGILPDIPECDVLAITGDVSPLSAHKGNVIEALGWFSARFVGWLKAAPARTILLVWGNHDWIGYQETDVQRMLDDAGLTHVHILTGTGCRVENHTFWGFPWTPEFNSWAFNASDREMAQRLEALPKNIDVLISHGPPYGVCDYVENRFGRGHVGSRALRDAIEAKTPKLVLCGHIHGGYGEGMIGESKIKNVSLMSELYQPVNRPQVVYL